MDSARFLESSRGPYVPRQASLMAFSGNLSSGKPYHTVESLEGGSLLPPLKSSFGPSVPIASERDALLGLDARTRALLAARDNPDASARPFAFEREASYRRNVTGSASFEGRAFGDGLTPIDIRSSLDGRPPVDIFARPSFNELQRVDPLARGLGLDMSTQEALRPGAPMGGLARGVLEQRSESVRGMVPPFLPLADARLGRKDIEYIRPPAVSLHSSISRRDITDRGGGTFPRMQRSVLSVEQEPRPGLALTELVLPSDENKPTFAGTPQREKKWASDAKAEALPSAKRPKTSEPVSGNGTPVEAADADKGTADVSRMKAKNKKRRRIRIREGKDVLTCDICNKRLTVKNRSWHSVWQRHLEGRHHTSQLRKLAVNSEVPISEVPK